jgi:predicted MPP superfamily phosphohydrolase
VPAQLIVFLLIVTAFWVAVHVWLVWRLAVPFAPPPATLVGLLLAAAALALGWVVAMVAVRGAAGDSVAGSFRSLVWLYWGFVSIVVVAVLARDAGLLLLDAIARFGGDGGPVSPERRALFARAGSIAALAVPAAATAVGFRAGTRLAPVVRVDLPIAGLHPDLDGYRILQLTDIHVGQPLKRSDLEAIVARANGVGADLIALTGDLVDARVPLLASECEPIADLRAPDGVFFVTGNHEYYSGAKAWERWIAERGLRVLTNEHTVVTRGAAKLLVGGVTDFEAHRFEPADASDPAKAIAGAPDVDYRVLLAHQPKSVPAAREAGWQLQLSGHTHGGQYAPFSWIIDLFHPVSSGLTRLPGFDVYVSRGTGLWGPPMRLGAPNEMTEIVLRRA